MAFIIKISTVVVLIAQILKVESFLGTTELDFDENAVNTRDHMIITKSALISVAMEFVLSHPEYLKTRRPAEFMNKILNHEENPQMLRKAMESISPELEFINAMSEIQIANAEVDASPMKHKAAAHFDGEQFNAGKKRLTNLKSQIISALFDGKKLEHARKLSGKYLHTLQDFYSRSNWIELGNTWLFDNLTNSESKIRAGFFAASNESTCRACTPIIESKANVDDCYSNLITKKLTSGYSSGQDVSKPLENGKCSRGGRQDSSRFLPATGGINKDSYRRIFSPHHSLHLVAKEFAIEASKVFFREIRTAVGDEKFAKFLNLKSDHTLAFVIDVSGSMREEIKDVKGYSANFVKEAVTKGGGVFTYILVPFSDPDVGPVTVTSNPEKVLEAVGNLQATAGGDCKEKGMTGLYQALLRSTRGSFIYYFSDAGVKDSYLENDVLALAKEKQISITFFITGKCQSRKRRSSQVPLRKRRATAFGGLYERLASATGGQVLSTTKPKVAGAMKIIGDAKPFSVLDPHKRGVVLLTVEGNTVGLVTRVHRVAIDNTLNDFVIILTASRIMRLTVNNATDTINRSLSTQVISRSRSLLIVEARNVTSGEHDVIISCSGPYTLQVTSRSQVDFTYRMMAVTKTGDITSISGNLLKGQKLLLSFEMSGNDQVGTVSSLFLLDKQGNLIHTYPVREGKGLYRGTYCAIFIPPERTFRLQVIGFDREGAKFNRVKSPLHTVGTTELKRMNVENDSSLIFPGESLVLKFNLKNKGKSSMFDVEATDDLSYIKHVSLRSVRLPHDASTDILVTLHAPVNATSGDTATVTLHVSPSSFDMSSSNFIISYVTVAAKNPDISPPNCTVLGRNGSCDTVHKSHCKNTTWSARLAVTDAGDGLRTVEVVGNNKGRFSVDAFTEGTANMSVGAVYVSSCCQADVTVVAIDMAGNTGNCRINNAARLRTPFKSNMSDTERKLHLGESIKIPFSFTNLGSRTLFTFEVSKVPSFLSFVSPLSVFLHEEETAQLQLSVTSLPDASYGRTEIDVKAVPRLSNAFANEDRLHLFTASLVLLKRVKLIANMTTNQVVVHERKTVSVHFEVTNIMSTETFALKVHPQTRLLAISVQPQLLTMKTNQTAKVSVTLTASSVSNSHSVSMELVALPHLNKATTEPLLLLNLHVKVIPEKKTGFGVSVHLSTRVVRVQAGETESMNFTVTNRAQTVTSVVFEVYKSGFSLASRVLPIAADLYPSESLGCHLEISSTNASATFQNESVVVYVSSSTSSRNANKQFLFEIRVLVYRAKEHNVMAQTGPSTSVGIIAGIVTAILVFLAIAIFAFIFVKCSSSRRTWKVEQQRGKHIKIDITSDTPVDEL